METDAAIADASNPPTPPNPLERQIDIAVDVAALQRDIGMRLREYGKNLKLPGFRPGKVPASLVRQQFGEKAQNEALSDALGRDLQAALATRGLRMAGLPRLEKMEDDSPSHLKFSAVFEVYPEVALHDLSAMELERPVFEVGEQDVEATVDILRKQRVRYEAVERPAAAGDRITLDFTGQRDDGEPFPGGQARDYRFVLGSGSMLSAFEDAVLGTVAGESKHFAMTIPADYFSPDLAGKAVSFDITVKQVEAAILPEADSELARELGIEDGDTARMRAEIENNLQREVKKRLRIKLTHAVMEMLIAAHPIDVPRALVTSETQRLMELAKQNMERRGAKPGEMPPMQAEWFAETARRNVLLGLVLRELVAANQLEARPEQVRVLIEDAAQSYEHPEEVIRWFYAKKEHRNQFEAVALEDNVVAWVLERVKTTDKPLAFAQVMGDAA